MSNRTPKVAIFRSCLPILQKNAFWIIWISSIDIYTPSKGGVIYSNWRQQCSPPWFFQDCSLDPGGADVKMTDMFFPRWWPKVKDVTVTVADGALGLAVFAAPRLSTGLRFPELRGGPVDVPCQRGRRGRGLTSPEMRRACVCVWGGTNCTPHHRTSDRIGEWYGITVRMKMGALHRDP